MIDFSTLQGLTIPEGVVTQVTDSSGRVIWMVQSGDPLILEVEKITSNTYAGETTYNNEQFILLDIYPKTNGTVSVTYGGLTKTITDTSGAESPNAQEVFFGTFNGVSDSVETPVSGELTIDGDCYGFSCGMFLMGKVTSDFCGCVTAIRSFGTLETLTFNMFAGSESLLTVKIPNRIKTIGMNPFNGCTGLKEVIIPATIQRIDHSPFYRCNIVNPIVFDGECALYKIDGNCLIERSTNTVIQGFLNAVIPNYVEKLITGCFAYYDITNITIPASVHTIGDNAFVGCSNLTNVTILATTPPSIGSLAFDSCPCTITVPKGCGEAYKTATGWSEYANKIVEAS